MEGSHELGQVSDLNLLGDAGADSSAQTGHAQHLGQYLNRCREITVKVTATTMLNINNVMVHVIVRHDPSKPE